MEIAVECHDLITIAFLKDNKRQKKLDVMENKSRAKNVRLAREIKR